MLNCSQKTNKKQKQRKNNKILMFTCSQTNAFLFLPSVENIPAITGQSQIGLGQLTTVKYGVQRCESQSDKTKEAENIRDNGPANRTINRLPGHSVTDQVISSAVGRRFI